MSDPAPRLLNDLTIGAYCQRCEALSRFTRVGSQAMELRPVGNSPYYYRWEFWIYKCAGCGRGFLGELGFREQRGAPDAFPDLVTFLPNDTPVTALPAGVPEGVANEFREAERCAKRGDNRAASALLRSTLEKTLKANGYSKGSLADKIDAAGEDRLLSAARVARAHEDLRVLGNDVVHDEWKPVSTEEVSDALHYAVRVLEDFYGDRPTVESVLIAKGRISPTPAVSPLGAGTPP